MLEVVLIGLLVILGLYSWICLLFYLRQDRLLFFHRPRHVDPERQAWLANAYPDANIEVTAPNGDILRGWLLKPPAAPAQTPLVIYFGGISEEVSATAHLFERFAGWALLLVNYNGYGDSTGKPAEKAFFQSALAIYDAVAARDDVDMQRIVVCGRSMGTGVAVYLAAHRTVSGVILISPYDTLINVVRHAFRSLRWLPLSLLAKHPFNSVSLAPSIHAPLLALAGQYDTLITPACSQRLVEHWKGTAELKVVLEADHNTITDQKDFWQYVTQFLAGMR